MRLHVALIALVVASCSGPTNTTNEVVLPTDGNLATAEPLPLETPANVGGSVAGNTVGGDGSEITLSALSPADVEGAKLTGELGCSFTADDQPLLVAKGNVGGGDPARGVVKVGDYVEPVGAPGGFNAMVKGAKFSGQGKTVTIALTGPAIGGGESPPRPATLTYDRADGAKRVLDGRWNCGP